MEIFTIKLHLLAYTNYDFSFGPRARGFKAVRVTRKFLKTHENITCVYMQLIMHDKHPERKVPAELEHIGATNFFNSCGCSCSATKPPKAK